MLTTANKLIDAKEAFQLSAENIQTIDNTPQKELDKTIFVLEDYISQIIYSCVQHGLFEVQIVFGNIMFEPPYISDGLIVRARRLGSYLSTSSFLREYLQSWLTELGYSVEINEAGARISWWED